MENLLNKRDMRKVFLLLLLLLAIPVASMAQEMREVVHLRNGSVIKGVVIEQVPGKSLKIQTPDGSVFAYDMSEVEKVTKEASSASYYRSGEMDIQLSGVQSGYRGFFDVGHIVGAGDYGSGINRVEYSTTHGYQFNPHFFFGVGVGVNYYYDYDCVGIPIFVDVRANILNSKVSPFIDFKAGYSVNDFEGVYCAPTVGCRFNMGGTVGLNLGIGYTLQKYDIGEKVNGGGFHVKVGVDF